MPRQHQSAKQSRRAGSNDDRTFPHTLISRYRELMGATNPANAAEGTIRKKYAESIEANSVHGSDAPETAAYEMSYFFNALEITG